MNTQMISGGILVGTGVLALMCFLVPIGALVVVAKKSRHVLKPFFTGMAVFLVFQIFTRIPLLQLVLPQMDWYLYLQHNPVGYGLFLGATAGLFEEGGRLLAFTLVLKKERRLADGIAFGLGHGGIEAMLLVGAANAGNLIYMLMINQGSYDQAMSAVAPGTAELMKNQLLGVTALPILLAGLERLFTMVCHVGFSVMVLYGVKKRSYWYVLLAFLIHTVLDASLVILPAVFGIGSIGLEVLAGIAALGFLLWLLYMGRVFKADRSDKLGELR